MALPETEEIVGLFAESQVVCTSFTEPEVVRSTLTKPQVIRGSLAEPMTIDGRLFFYNSKLGRKTRNAPDYFTWCVLGHVWLFGLVILSLGNFEHHIFDKNYWRHLKAHFE